MIFYCETRLFSGQERMFMTAACHISKKEQCFLVINENNNDGIAFAKAEGCFHEIKTISDFKENFSSITVWFRWLKIFELYRFFLEKQDTVCVSQGRIESGNIGLIAAKLARLKTISYIPMVHSHREMGGESIVNKIKDSLCKPLYHLPDSFITISHSVKNELTKKCNVPISVVENFVQQKKKSIMKLEPPFFTDPSIYKILIPGRLLNKQKGQLDFINVFKEIKNKVNKKAVCYIVGDGPDYSMFDNEIGKEKLKGSIFLLGNRDDLLNIMAGSDLVVLPSRFEGVPLVLLEAASLNANVLASDIIGFNDYLPQCNLFVAKNLESLKTKTIEKINNPDSTGQYRKELIELIQRRECDFTNDYYIAISLLRSNRN